MIHYHGTPISPRSRLETLAGEHFCVSFWRPDDIKPAHRLGQSVMLDNGAFSAWRASKRRRRIDPTWSTYYEWCEIWLVYPTTWAIIPDVIDGDEEANDELIAQWPFGHRGTPVWHLHESLVRLELLSTTWPRVCIGSSGDYSQVGKPKWHRRMFEAMEACCDDRGRPRTWLHMLRGMSLSSGPYPFASVDSTDVGRNHNRSQNGDIMAMARRWDAQQPPAIWNRAEAAVQLGLNPFTLMALSR